MALDWLPDALKDYHARSFPWQGNAPAKGVLHTTEGSGWPTYNGWTIMPHATILPTPGKGVAVRQHLPFSQGSFALVNAPGGVNTNGLHAFQFELIGTSEKGGPGLYWPDADDAVLLDLYKKVIKPLDDGFRIPFRAAPFLPYPASYGNTAVRFSGPEWVAFSGWCGHEHVPENDHGDPGAFPWTRLVQLATGDDDMTTDESVRAIVRAELAAALPAALKAALGPIAEAVWNTHGGSPTPVAWTLLGAAAKQPAVPTAADIAAAVATQFKALPAGTATVDDATIDKLATAVWDKGAARLVR